jgi:hypothetical protein
MATNQSAEAYDDFGEFPESWIWDQNGEMVSGAFVEFTRGQTRDFGPKPIVVLEVDGQRRSIWLNTAVLFRRFKDELQQRPEHRLVEGEQITIRRLNKVESPDAIGPYWKFRVVFQSSPEPSVDEMFGPRRRATTRAASGTKAGREEDQKEASRDAGAERWRPVLRTPR